ncbi:MAG TPA: alpha/beta fold hydrolase [Pseudolabrys sp.]|nr:alpha/beta fold hydrolase [Pseudolabrys sp.]
MLDILRCAQGDAVAAWGVGPSECPYRVAASGEYWRLRDYGDADNPQSLLIVAAPIKRPYIWDLAPSASALRYCLANELHVYLLEWMPASRQTAGTGIEECAFAIAECIRQISNKLADRKPFLIGHSLGGTLAAIYAAMAPESVGALVLLGAPLCFRPGTSQFRDTLVSLVPPDFSEADPFPGSLLSHMSALASPGTFIWSRLMDAALSIPDARARDIHARVERWALDEVPLPGKLVRQIITELYRENRLCRGALRVGGALIGPSALAVPTLAAVNVADEVAPLASVQPFVDAMPTKDIRVIEHAGEVGVGLQHLGILIGREALAEVWPEIISWMKSHG